MAVSASSVHLLSIFDAAMRLMAVQERARLAEVGAVAVGGRRFPGGGGTLLIFFPSPLRLQGLPRF